MTPGRASPDADTGGVHARFFQTLAIKIAVVVLLSSLGKAPWLLSASAWCLAYCCVSAAFAVILSQRLADRHPNHWDQAMIFALLAYICHLAAGLIEAPVAPAAG